MARRNQTTYVEGAKELNAALRRVGDRASGLALRNAAEKGATVIADEARELAPEESGLLRKSIGVEPYRVRVGQATFHIGVTDRRAWYFRLLELGTKYIAPLGFFRRAMDTKRAAATEAMGEQLRRSLRDVLS